MRCGSPEKTRLPPCPDRDWTRRAITMLQGDGRRSADTHLVNPIFPGLRGISIYLKDESTHPTGSLKHRLARSLFLYGICNGRIRKGTTLVEASSGSTAVSEAYFAKLLDLPFIAVVPEQTSRQKIEAIERFGGRCQFVDAPDQVTKRPPRSLSKPILTTLINSPMPSGQPIGGATITSRKASLIR
jgi:cysteine synthase A